MNINRKEPQTNVPQNVGSKEDQISKNIRSRHTQNTAMLILLLCTQCVLHTMLIVVRQQSIGSWLSTISIAEFLMYFPFHTIQLTHKIPTRLYMGTLAGRALFGWSLSVSVYVGYYRGYLHWRDKWCSEVNGSKRFRVSRDSMLPVYHCWIRCWLIWAAQVTPNLCVAAKIAFWILSGGAKAAKFKDLKYCWLKGLICRFI